MPGPLSARPRVARVALMVLLLGLHVALLGVLQFRHVAAAGPAGRMLVTLELRKPPPAPTPAAAAPRRASLPRPSPLIEGSGTAPLLTTAAPAASAPGAEPAPTPSAQAPLNLSLPPGSAATATLTRRNPALTDPRSHSVRRDRMAAALGSTACMLDELQPDGSIARIPGHYNDVPTASSQSDPFGHGRSTGGGFEGGAALGGGMRGTTAQAGGGGKVTVCIPDRR